ncbi:MAG TPA: hypothetical protein VKJ07_24910, partial [Mycobacteriales bacterium]|nr:hypothetical protein [Mycobacteriales bacterium]
VAMVGGHGFAAGGGTIAGAQPSSFGFSVRPPRRGVLQGSSLFVVQVNSTTSYVFWNAVPFGPPNSLTINCTPCTDQFKGNATAQSYDRLTGAAPTSLGTGFTLQSDGVDNGTTGVPPDTYGFIANGPTPFTQPPSNITTGDIVVRP